MEVIWKRERATVAEVADALEGQPGSAYNTVLTMTRILTEKGYLNCRKQGRAHVYTPKVSRTAAARNAARHLLGRFFDGSPGALVLNFLEHEDLSSKDLEELKRKIRDADEEERT